MTVVPVTGTGAGATERPRVMDLAAMDVARRAAELRCAFEPAGIDGLLVTNLTNIRYLTGFTGSAGLLLVSGDGMTLITDGRYGQQASSQLAAAGVDAAVEVASSQQAVVVAAVTSAGIGRLGLEAASVSWSAQRTYAGTWFPSIELVPTADLVEHVREIKDEGEIQRIEAAAEIADTALAQVRSLLAESPTETEFGLELDTAMRRLGADDVSFETIVASGPNGALPHHRPGNRTVAEGDLVVLDFGALVDGYHSDMTRTIVVGEPSAVQRRMYDVVLESQAAGVAAVAAGVDAADVDRACRSVIAAAGWEEAFLHGTGHGVGLDIHEAPRVGKASADRLSDRCVVTVEPGVYLPGRGGVRIEDTVVVTHDGCRPVTLAPKSPAV